MSQSYTIRVYGLLLQEDKLLISSEHFKGVHLFKFPGGGMEAGEGTLDALKREFMEEMNLSIRIERHLYTTDFYIESAFDPSYQVMSVYYLVSASPESIMAISTKKPGHIPAPGESESFQWYSIDELNPNQFTFPTEEKAFLALLEYLKNSRA